jgi:hypothetical protein
MEWLLAIPSEVEEPKQTGKRRFGDRALHVERRSQPVGATPSDMNSFSKGGVYGARKTGQALHGAEDRHVAPLEGGRVVA